MAAAEKDEGRINNLSIKRVVKDKICGVYLKIPEKTRNLILPGLTIGGASIMVATGPTPGVHSGGVFLSLLGANVAGIILNKDKYDAILGKIGINSTIMSGIMGLSACASLGTPHVIDMVKEQVLDSRTFIVFANFAPWLAVGMLDTWEGAKIKVKKNIPDSLQVKTEKISQTLSISSSAHASLSTMGAACIMTWGILNGFAPAAITGALFTSEGIIRNIRENLKTGTTLSQNIKDIGKTAENCLKLPLLIKNRPSHER